MLHHTYVACLVTTTVSVLILPVTWAQTLSHNHTYVYLTVLHSVRPTCCPHHMKGRADRFKKSDFKHVAREPHAALVNLDFSIIQPVYIKWPSAKLNPLFFDNCVHVSGHRARPCELWDPPVDRNWPALL